MNRYDMNKESGGSCLKVSPGRSFTGCNKKSRDRNAMTRPFVLDDPRVLTKPAVRYPLPRRKEEGTPGGRRRENHEVIPTGWL